MFYIFIHFFKSEQKLIMIQKQIQLECKSGSLLKSDSNRHLTGTNEIQSCSDSLSTLNMSQLYKVGFFILILMKII